MRQSEHPTTMATRSAEPEAMPAGVGYVVNGVLGLLIAGGLYLIAVRGEALVADLGALVALICG
ncbi:MAG: hypothetical protein NW205_07455 [Hyphomicrobiaceae bacterium]|nr:hypothetical protein [Hyphomicrobiaceae bacterium]